MPNEGRHVRVGARQGHAFRLVLFTITALSVALFFAACPSPVDLALGTAVSDKIAPTATIASPRNGQTYSASVTVTGTIIDDALKAGDGKGTLKSIDYAVANDVLRKGRITLAPDGTATQDTTFGSGAISWSRATSTFSFDISTVTPTSLRGLITLTIDAEDANGNVTTIDLDVRPSANTKSTVR